MNKSTVLLISLVVVLILFSSEIQGITGQAFSNMFSRIRVPSTFTKCSDSDGGQNYNLAGTVTISYLTSQYGKEISRKTYTDSCKWARDIGNTGVITEYYCSNNKLASTEYKCPSGCSNGACTKEEIKCTDSDGGKNYNIRGNIYGLCKDCKPPVTGSNTDHCVDANNLREFYCTDSNGWVREVVNCPNGCKDGACTEKNTTQKNCKNNDYYCPWECNDWKLDNDCGAPQIYNFVETRTPSDYLISNMIHWDDTDWRSYQPLINKVNEITTGITDDFEKAKKIANWVKTSKSYGFPSPANEGKSVIEIFNSNTGVCMDAAILTAAMFRIADIPSRAILPGFHEYTEGHINGKWIGFDATFGSGDVQIIDPVTSIVYNNEFYTNEPKFITIFSDGTPREIINVSYYKINIIPRTIYKSGEANIKIVWSLNTQEPLKEKYCNLSSFKTGQSEIFSNSPISKIISNEDNTYSLNCVVIHESDPYTAHYEVIIITFTGIQIKTENSFSSGYVKINVETLGIQNNFASLGTVYIPTTSMTVFKNTKDYSLAYDKSQYADFTDIRWVIKSDNLNCNYYYCNYVNSNGYSTHISPTGIVGYGTIKDFGTRDMPPGHYNGYSQITLPDGKYKIIYLLDGDDVGYTFFEVLSNQKIVIYPNRITKFDDTTQNKYDVLNTALTNSIEGLSP